MRILGRRLELVRRRRGWTYEEFSARTGIPSSTLHYLIRHRVRPVDYLELRAIVTRLGEPWDAGWERLWRQAVQDDAAGRAVSDRPAPVMPQQLPADTAHFIGRDRELATLLQGRCPAG